MLVRALLAREVGKHLAQGEISPDERRRHPRRNIEGRARLRVGERVVDARLRDICREAVLLDADTWFPLGKDVHVTLELPAPHAPILAAGQVVRLTPGEEGMHGMAVLFTDITAADVLRIDVIVERDVEAASGDTGDPRPA